MNVSRKLMIRYRGKNRVILFGEAITEGELQEVFRLRYTVYSERGYIDNIRYPNGLEIDEYDELDKTRYFIATVDDGENKKIIGCIRLIICDPLPTELDFEFKEPKEICSISRDRRFEIGRFIVIPPDKLKEDYLPRGIVMLFLLDSIGEFGIKNGLEGGYAFIKQSLSNKLKQHGFPIGYIDKFKQLYPKSGVLYKYFTQEHDPVIPIFFITRRVFAFSHKATHRRFMFKIEDGNYIFKDNFFTNVLKLLKIV